MPGGPDMRTARKMFMPLLPGFLKLDFKLDDLSSSVRRVSVMGRKKGRNGPVVQPLLELLYLTLVPANLFERLRRIPCRPELRRQVRFRAHTVRSASAPKDPPKRRANGANVPARLDLGLGLTLLSHLERLGSSLDRLLLPLHLLARLVVERGTPGPARPYARPDQREKRVLGERLEPVFLYRGELGRASVVAQDDVGRLGGRLEGDAAGMGLRGF